MITSAVMWKSCYNDILGVCAFEEGKYDFSTALKSLANDIGYNEMSRDDMLLCFYFDDDDDETLEWIMNYLSETEDEDKKTLDKDNVVFVTAINHHFTDIVINED